MNYMEGAAEQIVWVAHNTAFNLGFVPADKLDWKPEPTAKSALEIAHEIAGGLKGMQPLLNGGAFVHAKTEPFKTLEEAQSAIVSNAEAFAAATRAVDPADFHNEVDLGFMKASIYQIALMATTEVTHHHGQIAYIQTLLGDVESHFDMAKF